MDIIYKFAEQFLVIAIPVLVPIIAAWLIAKTREILINAKTWNPTITEILEEAAKMAIMAAEQAGVPADFKTKKDYAITVAQEYLKLRGIKIDLFMIDAAIESAVMLYIHGGKEIKNKEG